MTRTSAIRLGVLLIVGCTPRPPAAPVLGDAAGLSPDVRIEQSVAFRMGDREMLGRGVVVKRGDRLDVFLLAPTGNRLARFSQVGTAVDSDVRAQGLDRIDPRWLLHDVRFAFFPACPSPGPAASCRVGAFDVSERRDDAGDAVERTVRGSGIRERITLSAWTGEGTARHPGRVHVAQESVGYTLDIAVDAWEAR